MPTLLVALLGALVVLLSSSCSEPERTPSPEPERAAEEPGAPPARQAPESAEASATRRPNVVLVSLDTLRADRTSPYGYDKDTSPALAELAGEGARFEQAYAHTATTAPSHATMFTSRLPLAHGIDRNGVRLRNDVPVLSEILAANGYRTAAFVSAYVLARQWGFDRGFEVYSVEIDDDPGEREATACAKSKLERCADQTIDEVLGWLREQEEDGPPFFLFVHLFDVHAPYNAPKEFRDAWVPERKSDNKFAAWAQVGPKYDSEIAFADRELSRLFEALEKQGLDENTLLIVTADHGEALGGHGVFTHGVGLYEEVLRVPLLVRLPGRIPEGLEIREPVGLVDLMPTVLDLVEIEPGPLVLEGRSLAPALTEGESLDGEHPLFLQRRYFETEMYAKRPVKGNAFGLRQGRWKYIETEATGARELYDLEADPREKENLAEAEPERVEAMARQVAEWKARSKPERPATTQKIRDSDRKKLRALGYVD